MRFQEWLAHKPKATDEATALSITTMPPAAELAESTLFEPAGEARGTPILVVL